MTKRNRRIALLFAMTLVFAVLFSVVFVVAEANHDCSGEDCPICCQMTVCENTLRAAGFAAAVVFFAARIREFVLSKPALAKKQAWNSSLVSLKVKLSD